VTRVTLRVYANSASSGGFQVRSVSSNTWGESTITYNNAPSVGNVLASLGSFGSSGWKSVDITSYISGNGTYSLAITTSSSTAINFRSREAESGARAPQLVIETSGNTPLTSTPTATSTSTPSNSPTPTATLTATATPTNTTTATQTPTAEATATPPSSSGFVLVGAGDIANCNRNQDELTAQLLDNIEGTVSRLGIMLTSTAVIRNISTVMTPPGDGTNHGRIPRPVTTIILLLAQRVTSNISIMLPLTMHTTSVPGASTR
jgi:hypothetical protein